MLKTCSTMYKNGTDYSVFVALSRELQSGIEVREGWDTESMPTLAPTSKPPAQSKRVKCYNLHSLLGTHCAVSCVCVLVFLVQF